MQDNPGRHGIGIRTPFSNTRRRGPCLGPVLRTHHAWLWILHFHRLSPATFHHDVDVQRLTTHSAHISGDRCVPDPFLCSPAEMGSPSGAWETLVVNQFRQVLSGFNAQTAHRVVKNFPTSDRGIMGCRHQHSMVATCQALLLNHLNTPQSRSPSAAAHIFNADHC